MATDNVAVATEALKTEITHRVERLKNFSGALKDNFETAEREVRRGLQRGRVAVENAVRDARHGIKDRPFVSVAASATGGLIIGLALGWLIKRRRK